MHGWGVQEELAGPCMGCRSGCWAVRGQGVQEESAELCKGDARTSMGRGWRILGLHTGEMWESVRVLGHAGWLLKKAGMDT